MDTGELEELVRTLTRRRDVLSVLDDRSVRKPVLSTELDVARSTVDRAIRELQAQGLVVRGDDGTTYASATDRIDPGVGRALEATVGERGRHEVVVTGPDWEGRLAWDAGVCAVYDGTVAIGDGTVEVAGECVDPR